MTIDRTNEHSSHFTKGLAIPRRQGRITFIKEVFAMLEENGRFFRSKQSAVIVTTIDGVTIDGITLIDKALSKYQVCHNDALSGCVTPSRYWETLEKIARFLNEGRQAEAIFLAMACHWPPLRKSHGDLTKANFNPAEPRSHGRWSRISDESLNAHVENVQYRGLFHDFALDDMLEALNKRGSITIKNIKVTGINGMIAIPDGLSFPIGAKVPYFIEIKTGFSSKFTFNQQSVYALICTSGHAISMDLRLKDVGLTPGVPLPPMSIMVAHTYGPGLPFTFHDYCTDFLEE